LIATVQEQTFRKLRYQGGSPSADGGSHGPVSPQAPPAPKARAVLSGRIKDVIENKGGHRLFYHDGKPIQRESDLQILYRFVWFGTPSDVGREANDGRGPVDFKISRGRDKTLVEMKLAAQSGIKVIVYFSAQEKAHVEGILDKLKILGHKDIVLIDARNDNKPSGSKA
jgi:hypothetical protein